MSSGSRQRVVAVSAVCLLLLVTRWPLIPDWLVNFDLANFAFALEDFSPPEHKPQPPGHAFFVGLTRLIRILTDDVMVVLTVAGLIAGLIAVISLARLAHLLSGPKAAIVSVVLLVLTPRCGRRAF